MDIKSLRRNAEAVHKSLVMLDDGRIATKTGCRIYIPSRYRERQIAVIGSTVSTIGYFAIVLPNGEYGVTKTPAMMELEPTGTTLVTIEGTEYIEFMFAPGATVIANINLVKDNILLYDVFDEFLARSRIPWFYTYRDVGGILVEAKRHTGTALGAVPTIIEMIVGQIARVAKERTIPYRQTLITEKDLLTAPVYIPMRSVQYGASNTTARINGSYLADGLDSAIVNPSQRREDLEDILRS